MRTGEKGRIKTYLKPDNSGVTLVELIIVIAIMSILLGMSGLGLSLAFSRDAQQCANLINDALKETRMLSMSKQGNYKITFTSEGSGSNARYVANIEGTDEDGNSIYSKKINLEGGENKRIASVVVGSKDIANTAYSVEFDRTKGSVKNTASDDVIVFDITSSRASKTAKVQLVPGTGKHTVGEFK